MTTYMSRTQKEISQKKLEEYQNYCKLIQWGRQNPVKFASYIFGIEMIDYQKWSFMQSWSKPYVLWLCSRGAGKTAEAAFF